jgi:hypothetical protein
VLEEAPVQGAQGHGAARSLAAVRGSVNVVDR